MKKRSIILLVLAAVLALSACDLSIPPEYNATTESSAPTETQPLTDPSTEPTEATTLPPHSALYIPGLSVEDVITYFNEVCLDAEFNNNGDPSQVQKWTVPIAYTLYGTPTGADLSLLEEFTGWLNTIEGFPGIGETDDPWKANLRIHFCSQQELLALMGSNFENVDGGVTFWYMDNEIYDAIICYRTDLNQYLRNSVILEEIYNGLGPIQDTALRPDSIIYSGFSDPQQLTEIDELILKLLYHPLIRCGMNAAECEAVIRQLYY